MSKKYLCFAVICSLLCTLSACLSNYDSPDYNNKKIENVKEVSEDVEDILTFSIDNSYLNFDSLRKIVKKKNGYVDDNAKILTIECEDYVFSCYYIEDLMQTFIEMKNEDIEMLIANFKDVVNEFYKIEIDEEDLRDIFDECKQNNENAYYKDSIKDNISFTIKVNLDEKYASFKIFINK